jgi:hypothetical protein
MRPRAIDVIPQKNYTLLIKFDNGEVKSFDVKPYFSKKAFEELKDIDLFNTVKISGLSVEWCNGTDICPDELYNNSFKE